MTFGHKEYYLVKTTHTVKELFSKDHYHIFDGVDEAVGIFYSRDYHDDQQIALLKKMDRIRYRHLISALLIPSLQSSRKFETLSQAIEYVKKHYKKVKKQKMYQDTINGDSVQSGWIFCFKEKDLSTRRQFLQQDWVNIKHIVETDVTEW